MARAHVAIIFALLLIAPAVDGAAIRMQDPARDIMLTARGLTIPVDSIDILGFEVVQTGPGVRSASISVTDLSRRGLEDSIFAFQKEPRRVWSVTQVFPDNTAIVFLAVQFADEDLRAAAIHVHPPSADVLPAKAELDLKTNTVRWTLRAPLHVPDPHLTFAFAALIGCDGPDQCPAPIPGASAYDMAPNDLAEPLLLISPDVWWDDLS